MATQPLEDGRSRRAIDSRQRREDLILDALATLLAERPLRELGVEDIAAAAGISRGQFYSYYKSKHEPFVALLGRIATGMLALYESGTGWWTRPPDVRPLDSLTATLNDTGGLWRANGPVLREASDLWNALPRAREHWQDLWAELVERTRIAIETERDRGVAPPGPDARKLAESLMWQAERLLFLALIELPGAMNFNEVMEMQAAIWMRAIYLSDDPDP